MIRSFLPTAIFVLLFGIGGAAQNPRPAERPPEPKTGELRPREHDQEVSLPEEMRIKMAIARAESDHKKVLEDVEKMSDLCSEIAKEYAQRKQLSADDMKKLGTIEKLAKRVLTSAGGEEVDDKSASTDRIQTSEAINKLNAAAETIRKDMKAETRFVVSATVIANSNQVIHLSRYIRHAPKVD